MISEKIGLSWIANGRVDMIDREVMRSMKEAGCHLIKFGVESGDDTILKNLNKGTTISQAEEVFRIAREEKLDTHAHIVFGAPGETIETVRKTVEFVKKIRATTVSFGILTPYAGTELFEQVAAFSPEIRDGSMSTMENLHVEGFFSEKLCGLSGDVLSHEITRAYRHFYIRPGYLLERLASLRSWDELMVSLIAGLNVFQFALSGKK